MTLVIVTRVLSLLFNPQKSGRGWGPCVGKVPEPESDNVCRDLAHFPCYMVLSNHRTDLLSTVESNYQAVSLDPPTTQCPMDTLQADTLVLTPK